MLYSSHFWAAQQALERHIDKENDNRSGEGNSDPSTTTEHEGFTDGGDGDIDF